MKDITRLMLEHMDVWTAAETEKKSGRGRAAAGSGGVYGVKKLRELILELAVRGKLVEQDPSDEPASELLKRIAAEKARLVANRTIRKGQVLPLIVENGQPYPLPVGWAWAHLGTIGDWGAGATPARNKAEYYGGTIPWFKSGELTADFIETAEESITEKALAECSLRLNHPGDVLLAMYGATIGKTAILQTTATTNQAVCACTPFAGVFNQYLLILLKAMKASFISQGAGGAQPNISREKIIVTVAGFPPNKEQHRIVAKVAELMALCAQLETHQSNTTQAHEQLVSELLNTLTLSQNAQDFSSNWQRIAAHFDDLFTTEASIDLLKQTVLQLAVMGKLVEQDPSDEPASVLLDRMRRNKTKQPVTGREKKEKVALPITTDEKPFALPECWVWTRLGGALDIVGGVTLGRKLVDADMITLPYLRVANVQRGGLLLDDVKTVEIRQSELVRYQLLQGDLLVTEGGDWDKVGRTAIWNCEIEVCLHQNHIFRMRPHTIELSSLWIEMYMNSAAKAYFQAAAKQTTNLASINMTQLKSCLLAIPPSAEQNRIITKVNELMAICDNLKARIQSATQLQQTVADALVEQSLV